MKTVKRVFFLMALSVLMLMTLMTASAGAEDWSLSDINTDHTSVSFQISGVESAQSATLVIEAYDWNTDESTELCDIPFDITAATQRIALTIPEESYLTADDYYVYVKDAYGNKSDKFYTYVSEHYPDEICVLYPEWAEVSNYGDRTLYVYLTVGFAQYSAAVGAEETVIIDYPLQKTGTVIEVLCEDGYGCSNSYTKNVDSEYLSVPRMTAFKDSITSDGDSLEEDERVVASVEGKLYYSAYGSGKSSYEEIPDFIKYPQVSDKTTSITVWVESKNGSKSDEKELKIEDCFLWRDDVTNDALPAQCVGSLKDNSDKNKFTKVSTIIAGTEYSCTVDKYGNYKLVYPRQAADTELVLRFEDKHGCYVEDVFKVENILDNATCYIEAVPLKATDEVNKDCRIAAKIGDKVYYSEYAEDDDSCVTVSYPKQALGSKIQVWYEKKDTSYSPVYTIEVSTREYYVSVKARTGSLNGIVEVDYDNDSTYKVYVKVDGKEYECAMTEKESEYSLGAENYYKISCKYPKQKIGKSIQIIVRDTDGYEYKKDITLKNIKPEITIKQLDTSSTRIQGETEPKSKVTIKIGKKSYKVKANKKGKFSLKIKSRKSGTKIKISVVTPEGYKGSIKQKVSASYGYVTINNPIYRTSSTVNMNVYGGKKGDKVKLYVGSKTYTKTLKKNKKQQTVSFKISKAAAGTNVIVSLYDKFNHCKDSRSTTVYYGDKITVGMSEKNALLTTWGAPHHRNDWGTGSIQWVYYYGVSTMYVYVSGGRVVNVQRLNY